MRCLKLICRGLWVCFLVWFLFMWLCRPIVALHYSPKADETIGFFLDTEFSVTKRELSPGQSAFIPTAMNPHPDMWVTLSFPVASRDVLHITEPFSRIDVYIGPAARIERTEIRHGFFARFSAPRFHDQWHK